MSNLMAALSAGEALRVPVWTRAPAVGRFSAWGSEPPHDEEDEEQSEPVAEPAIDLDMLQRAAFADGYAAGLDTGRCEADAERAAIKVLAKSLEALRPEPTAPLGAMLATTVERLVAQILGEVAIDPATLFARCEAAAALVADEARPSLLRLHPADFARIDAAALPVAVEADGSLAPGALKLETASGWIEDSPALRLEKLRGKLDHIAAVR